MSAPHELLCFLTTELTAQTHRGKYVLTVIRDDSRWNGQGYAFFHAFDGDLESVGPTLSAPDVLAACCDQHAARQPAHPSMLGWPACGEVTPC
jgi:hypothetical protein